jgi:hypothetical protein
MNISGRGSVAGVLTVVVAALKSIDMKAVELVMNAVEAVALMLVVLDVVVVPLEVVEVVAVEVLRTDKYPADSGIE